MISYTWHELHTSISPWWVRNKTNRITTKKLALHRKRFWETTMPVRTFRSPKAVGQFVTEWGVVWRSGYQGRNAVRQSSSWLFCSFAMWPWICHSSLQAPDVIYNLYLVFSPFDKGPGIKSRRPKLLLIKGIRIGLRTRHRLGRCNWLQKWPQSFIPPCIYLLYKIFF